MFRQNRKNTEMCKKRKNIVMEIITYRKLVKDHVDRVGDGNAKDNTELHTG
jgi:hypothetical protein